MNTDEQDHLECEHGRRCATSLLEKLQYDAWIEGAGEA